MKKLLGIAGLLVLVATTGCEIENRGYHRGGVYGGAYGEYPARDYGHGRDRDHYRDYDRDGRNYHPYDRDHYYNRDSW